MMLACGVAPIMAPVLPATVSQLSDDLASPCATQVVWGADRPVAAHGTSWRLVELPEGRAKRRTLGKGRVRPFATYRILENTRHT